MPDTTKESGCGICSQCILPLSGGICPVKSCPKGLLNGQCGGVKNGTCEVNAQHPCAWEVIYARARQLGCLQKLTSLGVQLRDHSKEGDL